MTSVRSGRAPRFDVVVPLLAWVTAGAVGWSLHHGLADPGAGSLHRAVAWSACVVAALVLGALPTLPLPSRESVIARAAGVGWAVATSAGWYLGVEVGGPLTGVATGLALAVGSINPPGGEGAGRVVLIAFAGLIGAVGGWVLAGGGPTGDWDLVAPTGGALVAVAAASTLLLPGLAIVRLCVLVVGWATAWVGAWALASSLVSSVSVGLSIAAEIMLAMLAGGAVSGLAYRRIAGEPAGRVTLRWGAAALGGVAVGVVVAAGLRLLLGGELVDHLDVGTAVGLGGAAWFALLPTLRRIPRGPSAP